MECSLMSLRALLSRSTQVILEQVTLRSGSPGQRDFSLDVVNASSLEISEVRPNPDKCSHKSRSWCMQRNASPSLSSRIRIAPMAPIAVEEIIEF